MIPDSARRSPTYTGTGSVSGYAFTFKVFADSDVQVIVADTNGVESTLALGSDYTVARNGDQETYPGGTINLTSPLALNYQLVVLGGVAYSQTSQLPTGGAYNATVIERALDRVTILVQQVKEIASRGLRLSPLSDSSVEVELPPPNALSVIGWDAAGTSLRNFTPDEVGVNVSYAQWRTQLFNGTGAQTAFVLDHDAGDASNIDLRVNNVPQTPGVNYSYNNLTNTITFLTGAPAAGTNNVVARYGQGLAAATIGDASVTTPKIADGAVTTAKIADGGVTAAKIGAALRNYHQGFLLSSTGFDGTATITVAQGQCADSTNATLIDLTTSIEKARSGWAAGTGNGGLDTGTIANSTWYHFYVIRNSSTGAVDVLFSLSSTFAGATKPSGFTQGRWVGAAYTDGSGVWTPFKQTDDFVSWESGPSFTHGASGLLTLTSGVPGGVKVWAKLSVTPDATGTATSFNVADPNNTSPAAGIGSSAVIHARTDAAGYGSGSMVDVLTNTSRQVYVTRSGSTISLRVYVIGFDIGPAKGRNG